MKTNFCKTIGQPLIACLALLAMPATAQVNYAISGSTAYVTNSPNASGNIVIASTYNGFPVTSIGQSAFSFCSSLTNVTIPGSVTSIGSYAFQGCTGLTTVTIPDSVTHIREGAFFDCTGLTSVTIGSSVTSIGDFAFYFCTGLTSVTIGSSVTSIGDLAFFGCTSLTNIVVGASNPSYSSLNGVLFDKLQTTLIEYPGGLGGSYTIPNSVTSIRNFAFDSCTNLTNVTIPNGVTNIGDFAFEGCAALTSAYFQGNAPFEGGGVFTGDGAGMTVYYLFGTTGWGSTFGGVPAVLWNPQAASFNLAGGHFGFNITGPTNVTIVVEACTNLANPIWLPVSTNTLTGGASSFSDPQSVNYPSRFYRFRAN